MSNNRVLRGSRPADGPRCEGYGLAERRRAHARPLALVQAGQGSDGAHVGGVRAFGPFSSSYSTFAPSASDLKASGDRGVVDEQILVSVGGCDEAVARVVAEPLHGTRGHRWTSG
jgi:hypothetical protein